MIASLSSFSSQVYSDQALGLSLTLNPEQTARALKNKKALGASLVLDSKTNDSGRARRSLILRVFSLPFRGVLRRASGRGKRHTFETNS